jgi:hypothetical protein
MKREIITDIPEHSCVSVDICNRKQYLEVLNKIRKLTHKIIIVQIDGPVENDPIINTAYTLLQLEKKEIVSEWYGTIAESSRGAVQYTFNTIRNRREFFGWLASLDSFWNGIEVDDDFPNARFDDIAFLDEQGKLLFFSTTHEDYFAIRKDLA